MENRKNTSVASGRISKKTKLISLLEAYDIKEALLWLENQRRSISLVSSLLFTSNQTIRWRAIELIGKLTAIISRGDMVPVRKLINHNFWMMNDESGNIGWYAPETIGEILYNIPSFIDEFGIMLPTFIDEQPFERGTHWAIGRVAEVKPDVFKKDFSRILVSLENSDPYIRIFTAKAVELIDFLNAKPKLEKLTTDKTEIELYNFSTGNLYQTTIAELVEDLLKKNQ